jgi:hypothetical protein
MLATCPVTFLVFLVFVGGPLPRLIFDLPPKPKDDGSERDQYEKTFHILCSYHFGDALSPEITRRTPLFGVVMSLLDGHDALELGVKALLDHDRL